MGTHDAFINSYVESKFQLSTFYRLLVMSKSILICQIREQKQRYYALTRSPNNGPENVLKLPYSAFSKSLTDSLGDYYESSKRD